MSSAPLTQAPAPLKIAEVAVERRGEDRAAEQPLADRAAGFITDSMKCSRIGTACAPFGPSCGSGSGSSRKNTKRGLLHSISLTRCGFCATQALMPGHDASVQRSEVRPRSPVCTAV